MLIILATRAAHMQWLHASVPGLMLWSGQDELMNADDIEAQRVAQ